jgi:hypothetical protein
VSQPLRLRLERHVRQVVNRVQCTRRIRIEPSELRINVRLCEAMAGDEFEAFAQRSI